MPPKKAAAAPAKENVSLGPLAGDGMFWTSCDDGNSRLTGDLGKLVFGVARIFASFNDTFVHVTDLRFVHFFPHDHEFGWELGEWRLIS
jgi:small subunit ribosomal protein S14e